MVRAAEKSEKLTIHHRIFHHRFANAHQTQPERGASLADLPQHLQACGDIDRQGRARMLLVEKGERPIKNRRNDMTCSGNRYMAAHIIAHAAYKLGQLRDRKSTRLNSSHVKNSYAVFCLKKKTGPHT